MRVFRVLPPEAESWLVASGLPRPPREICPKVATTDDQRLTTALIAPAAGSVFAISPGVPLTRQQVELKARAGADAAKLTILVDGQPLAAFEAPPYRAFWQLAPGLHRASVLVTDAQGKQWHSAEVEFTVEAGL